MTFKPNDLIASLHEYLIEHYREINLVKARELQSLDGCGDGLLTGAIQCHLAGMPDVAGGLIAKAKQFFFESIETREVGRRYSPGGTESLRLSAYALARWLAGDGHDAESLKEAVRQQEIWFDREGSDRTNVDLSLADYVDAEKFEILVRRFEIASLNKPKNLRQIRGEGAMSYVIARQRLGLEYGPEQVTDALQNFLKRNVPQWLDRGHFSTAARWMKIAHWQPGDDPIRALLKCYDYLPGIERPTTHTRQREQWNALLARLEYEHRVRFDPTSTEQTADWLENWAKRCGLLPKGGETFQPNPVPKAARQLSSDDQANPNLLGDLGSPEE